MREIAVFDFETDPFKFGRKPLPFTWGFYDGKTYESKWFTADQIDDDEYVCAASFAEFIKDKRVVLYAHNAGRFDSHYLIPFFEPSLKIINGRIAKCRVGICEIRDSFLILPLPLSAHKKDSIDYTLFEAEVRDQKQNRKDIENYLYHDCVYLYNWVRKFVDRFGSGLTLAGAGFKQLSKTGYEITRGTETFDDLFRQYYYGGRTQAFKKGVFKGSYQYVDMNSAYSKAMLYDHPKGYSFYETNSLPKKGPYFATIKAVSYGALPYQSEKNGLQFPDDNDIREYNVTSWEIEAGLETGTLDIYEVEKVYIPAETADFSTYVNKFYSEKLAAKIAKDKDTETFAKFMLNAVYGRFALNPRKFKKYLLTELGGYPESGDDWELMADFESDFSLWERPDPGDTYFNVAISASITGFVRAMLWRAIVDAKTPLYCDTDSLMCEGFGGEVSDALGDWKNEADLDAIYIGGRKLYLAHIKGKETVYKGPGIVSRENPHYTKWLKENFKLAHKGGRLTHLDLIDIVEHEKEIIWRNEAPTFSMRFGARFMERKFCRT